MWDTRWIWGVENSTYITVWLSMWRYILLMWCGIDTKPEGVFVNYLVYGEPEKMTNSRNSKRRRSGRGGNAQTSSVKVLINCDIVLISSRQSSSLTILFVGNLGQTWVAKATGVFAFFYGRRKASILWWRGRRGDGGDVAVFKRRGFRVRLGRRWWKRGKEALVIRCGSGEEHTRCGLGGLERQWWGRRLYILLWLSVNNLGCIHMKLTPSLWSTWHFYKRMDALQVLHVA